MESESRIGAERIFHPGVNVWSVNDDGFFSFAVLKAQDTDNRSVCEECRLLCFTQTTRHRSRMDNCVTSYTWQLCVSLTVWRRNLPAGQIVTHSSYTDKTQTLGLLLCLHRSLLHCFSQWKFWIFVCHSFHKNIKQIFSTLIITRNVSWAQN